MGDPQIAEPAPNACVPALSLSFKVSVGSEVEGEPDPYQIWEYIEGRPYTTIGEEVFGTGLETTMTLARKGKGGICIAQGFPEG